MRPGSTPGKTTIAPRHAGQVTPHNSARIIRSVRQIRDWLAFLALAGILIAVIAYLPQETVEGRVKVIDGDSLKIDGREIRLHGIDAPEARQTCTDETGKPWRCGRAATRELRKLIGTGQVTCTGDEVDRYDRLVAQCSQGDTDLNSAMVARGLAIAYTDHTSRYSNEEKTARESRRGMWAGRFERPRIWRERHGRHKR